MNAVSCAAPASAELLGERLCELAAHTHAAMAQLTQLAAAFDDTDAWAGYGIRSCAHWLSINAGFDVYIAAELLRVGHTLGRLPVTAAAFAGGELSLDKVRALCRVATPADEELWAELARQASGSQLARICREYRRAVEANANERAEAHLARRGLWAHWEDDGVLRLQALLPAEDGALVLAALEAVVRARDVQTREAQLSRSSDTGNGDGARGAEPQQSTRHARDTTLPLVVDPAYDTHAARRADALVSICQNADALADAGSNCKTTPPTQMVIHVDLGALTGTQLEGRCHLEDGPALSVAAARRIGCDAEVVAIIERDGLPIDVGRARRIVPTALRRAVQSRDQTCLFPGCGVPARLTHAHHIEHWLSGGATDRDNLASLCGFHHRRLHDGVYTIHVEADSALRFVTADGRSITVRQLRADDARHRLGEGAGNGGGAGRGTEPTGNDLGGGLRRLLPDTAGRAPDSPRAGDGGRSYNLGYVVGTMIDACEHAQRRAHAHERPPPDPYSLNQR